MSGKSARRLRRLTEQAMNAPQGSTTAAHNNGDYKEQPVMRKGKPSNRNKPAMTATIRLSPKDPRAFYQEAKRMYKTGEALAEAKRLEKEFRQDKLNAAKDVAKKIADIVEGGQFPKQKAVIQPLAWLEAFANWLFDVEHPLKNAMPMQALAPLSSESAGYFTITALDRETQNGVMFVISSAGYIRAYDGEIINILDIETAELTYSALADVLLADLRPTDQIENMEILDAQQE